MKVLLTSLLLLVVLTSEAQTDSTIVLLPVTVSAYHYQKPVNEVPAAVVVVNTELLTRFQNTSLLPVVNTVPGVRMEERSPGSYRFSIRGSLLRSPFGIRNVKFYLNGLPLTDGGGNTYLNLLDFSAVSSMEIIKGPGASVYGAGTGGVVLLSSAATAAPGLQLQTGSFGLMRVNGAVPLITSERNSLHLRTSYQQADGYREHSSMRRFNTALRWDHTFANDALLTLQALTSNLYYQTPGGLTRAQFETNPKQARPTVGAFRGAVDQQASITNQTQYVSASYEHDVREGLLFKTGLFGSYTDFRNPAILNVEERTEYNAGGRTEWVVDTKLAGLATRLSTGAEYQYFYSPLSVFDNDYGTATNLQTSDKLQSLTGLVFVQGDVEFPHNFSLTAGGSFNVLRYYFERTYPVSIGQTRTFSPAFHQRVALAKRFETASLYASISRGFSPPTLAEVRPSAGVYNGTLNAETGTSLELGVKSKLRALRYEVALYQFNLTNAIVIQRTPEGADYFINAGRTRQLGAEISLGYSVKTSSRSTLDLWASYALNDFYFDDYQKDNVDFSGKRLTGVPPNVLNAGVDVTFRKGFYARSTVAYTDHVPLNDANTAYGKEAWLLAARIGYAHEAKRLVYDVFVAGDNLLDNTYSLGYDLNAAGGRYYNAAPARNVAVGVQLHFRR